MTRKRKLVWISLGVIGLPLALLPLFFGLGSLTGLSKAAPADQSDVLRATHRFSSGAPNCRRTARIQTFGPGFAPAQLLDKSEIGNRVAPLPKLAT